ncbi:MAG: sirohydrochlorin cobaltochelatase [Lachnospiraceae bacterium]|nr:sirohydrochlorin cobaltochelatase [Lachnospiraceae bacterium]
MKNRVVLALCAVLATGLFTGCYYDPSMLSQAAPVPVTEEAPVAETAEETAEEAEEEDEENYETGDASLDDPRNQDDIGENELLVVSFGTSFNDSRRLTIGAIEADLAEAFPKFSVRRGFTSQIIIDHVKDRDGEVIDNVTEALDRAADNGVKTLVVQPTHLMHGYEYTDLVEELGDYADAFDKIVISEPLLTSDEDFSRVAEAVTKATAEYDDGETAICFMGHGTEAESNEVYAKFQKVLTDAGYENYYVGTVEATPSVDDVLAAVSKGNYKRVVLEPLMVVAGDHANNDMAGDEEDSWKSVFEAAGYEVVCLVQGLGENAEIREIYVEHAKEAITSELGDEVADASEMTTVSEVGGEGLTPLSASDIADGTYEIEAESSSSMFRITGCELTVEKGEMTAVLTMGGKGYLYVYPGSAIDAALADEKDYIPFEESADGAHTFTIPVEALDAPFELAAFSKNKEKWYDRTIVLLSDQIPAENISGRSAGTDGPTSVLLSDGTYLCEVTLTGGSGKASVESPAKLTVKDGTVTAAIVFSSPNYDYVLIDGEKLLPVNTEGNSTFEIPVEGFDIEQKITADTTAMSKPHEIDYTLNFDSSSIQAE